MRNKGRQPYSILTINGRIGLRRTRWHDPQAGSCTPSDALLDQAEVTISQGVRELACRLDQGSYSFAKTADSLSRAAHLKVSKETVRELIEAEGGQLLRIQRHGQLLPAWSAGDCLVSPGITRVYLGCDGVKVPLVTDEEKRKRRQKTLEKRRHRGRRAKPLPPRRAGADQPYKEFRVSNLYDETQTHRYVAATSGDHEAAGRLMRRMATEIQLTAAQEKIANIDGAPWIRNQIELHGLVDAIGLDFYHLRENAQKARRVVFGEDSPHGKQWLDELMGRFAHEGYDSGWQRLVAWRSMLRGAKRAAADRLLHYVAERHEMIRYPEFRQRGWQIGSGPTEAQCKTSTARIKGRGRRWNSAHAEAMMALACLEQSHAWPNYWKTLDPQRN